MEDVDLLWFEGVVCSEQMFTHLAEKGSDIRGALFVGKASTEVLCDVAGEPKVRLRMSGGSAAWNPLDD